MNLAQYTETCFYDVAAAAAQQYSTAVFCGFKANTLKLSTCH